MKYGPTTWFAIIAVATALVRPTALLADETRDIAKWTVMVFMNGDNNLEPFAVSDFLEMARLENSDDVNVVVQFDRSPHYSGSYGNWTQSMRFLIRKNMTPTAGEAVEDLGEVNMGDGAVLTDFVNWARRNYPAERYALVIWDHGQGWRFERATRIIGNPSSRLDRVLAARSEFLKPVFARTGTKPNVFDEQRRSIPTDYVTSGAVRYVSSDESSGDHMFNREIQDSLIRDVGPGRIDLIGFDACLMSMVETAYALREVANVMVSSEELEPGDGWDYERSLSPLITNPNLTPEQLATTIVDAYERHYDPIDSETTLSAIRLEEMSNLTREVTRLANECANALDSEGTKIRSARSRCTEYAPGYGLHGIDLKRFCEQLALESVSSDIKNAAISVALSVDTVVIANYAGADRQGTFGSSGIAIYFPSRKALYDTDPDGEGYEESNANYPVEFVQAERWDNFLHAYFVLNP